MENLGHNDRNHLSRRAFIKTCSSTLLFTVASSEILSLVGCAGGGSSGNPPASAPRTVIGRVATNEIGGTNLAALTSLGSAQVNLAGDFTVPASSTATQVLAVTDGQGTLRGIAVASPSSQTLTVDATASAAALVFLTPGILTLDPHETSARLTQIQKLNSFAALAQYVRQQTPRLGMGILATAADAVALTSACVNEWITSYKPHVLKSRDVGKSAGDVTITVNSTYSASGQQLLVSNIGWRFVDVFRFNLDAGGVPLSSSPSKITMAGAIPAGWGSLLGVISGDGVGSPTEATDTIPFASTTSLSTLEYWIYGMGFGPNPQNPTTSFPPVPDLTCWGYTWLYYAFMPALDTAIGLDHHADVELMSSVWTLAEPYLATFLDALAGRSAISVEDIAHTFADMYGAVVSNEALLKNILTTILKKAPSKFMLFLLEHLGTAMSVTNFLFNGYTLMVEPELAAVDLSFTSTIGITVQ